MIIGSGVDVIEIARIARVLRERDGRFERRVYTPAEIEHCNRASRSAPHFAVRFAAKEALMKAVGTGWTKGVRWVDIETRPGEDASKLLSGSLLLELHGAVGDISQELAKPWGGKPRAILAVSRSRTHAVATVLLEV